MGMQASLTAPVAISIRLVWLLGSRMLLVRGLPLECYLPDRRGIDLQMESSILKATLSILLNSNPSVPCVHSLLFYRLAVALQF